MGAIFVEGAGGSIKGWNDCGGAGGVGGSFVRFGGGGHRCGVVVVGVGGEIVAAVSSFGG